MQYFTVGTEEHPTYTYEEDPQHCFDTLEEAVEELSFLMLELPELGVTNVWHVCHVPHASKVTV